MICEAVLCFLGLFFVVVVVVVVVVVLELEQVHNR